METRFTQFLLGATGIACCAPLSAQTDDAQALRPSAYLRVFDVPATPSQESSHRFAWDSFIAVNLPAKLGPDTVRGEPDANISILAQTGSARNMAPVVWETYRQPDEIFLQPSAWNRYPQRNDPRSAQRAGRASPASEDKVKSALMKAPLDVVSGIDQPSAFIGQPLGPLLEQRGAYARYEVAVNQAYFRYIKRFQIL